MINKHFYIFLLCIFINNVFSLQFLKKIKFNPIINEFNYSRNISFTKNQNYKFFNFLKNNKEEQIKKRQNFIFYNFFNPFNFEFFKKIAFLKKNTEELKNNTEYFKKNIDKNLQIAIKIENKIDNFILNKNKEIKGKEYIDLLIDIKNLNKNNFDMSMFKPKYIKIIADLKKIIEENKIDYKLQIEKEQSDKYITAIILKILKKEISYIDYEILSKNNQKKIKLGSSHTAVGFKNYGIGFYFKVLIIHNFFKENIEFIESFSANNKFHKKFSGYLWADKDKKYILDSKDIEDDINNNYILTRENYEKYYKKYDDPELKKFTKEYAEKKLEEIISLIYAAKKAELYFSTSID